jgi:hypothetical protein
MKKSIKDILLDLQHYHEGLRQYYDSLKEKALNERARMMLDYLLGLEDKKAMHMYRYLSETNDQILNKWLSFVPGLPTDIFDHCIKNQYITAPLTVDDVTEIAIHYDECLIDFLTILTKETNCSGGADIFCSLLKQIQTQEKKLVRNSQLLQDM